MGEKYWRLYYWLKGSRNRKYNYQRKENNPEPDSMVTKFTYPFCVVKINSKEIIIK
jgi:hypothetical protein